MGMNEELRRIPKKAKEKACKLEEDGFVYEGVEMDIENDKVPHG